MKKLLIKIVCVFVIAVVLCPFVYIASPTLAQNANSTIIVYLGDANGDSAVNTADAVTVLRHCAGTVIISCYRCTHAADANQSSSINTADATTILRSIAYNISLGTIEIPAPTTLGELPYSEWEGRFVGSTISNKYHSHGCTHADKILIENAIWWNSTSDAEAAGYQACKVCNPHD